MLLLYNISGGTWWASDPHLVFQAHYPYLYSTNLSALIGLRILTHYPSFDVTVHYDLTPLLYLIVNAIPRAHYQ